MGDTPIVVIGSLEVVVESEDIIAFVVEVDGSVDVIVDDSVVGEVTGSVDVIVDDSVVGEVTGSVDVIVDDSVDEIVDGSVEDDVDGSVKGESVEFVDSVDSSSVDVEL